MAKDSQPAGNKKITISSNDKAVIIWQYNPANDPKVTAE